MTKFKRLIAAVLVVALCFSLMVITTAAADEFEPVITLEKAFDEDFTKVIMSVKTDISCGAVAGTITYPEGAVLGQVNVSETDSLEGSKYDHNAEENTVKFAVVTNAETFKDGDNYWIMMEFTGTITGNFSLSDVQVADITATSLKDTISIPNAAVVTEVTVINALGSQYRDPDAANNVAEGLRFGTSLYRTEGTDALPGKENKIAVECGGILAYDFVMKDKNPSETTIDLTTKVTFNSGSGSISRTNGVVIAKSSKWYSKTDTRLTYTCVVVYTNKEQSYNGKTYNLTEQEILFVPYVIYKNSGDFYSIEFGEQTSNSYNGVVEKYALAHNAD